MITNTPDAARDIPRKNAYTMGTLKKTGWRTGGHRRRIRAFAGAAFPQNFGRFAAQTVDPDRLFAGWNFRKTAKSGKYGK